MNDDIFFEAEYKLQNCIRVTLQVERFVTEVEVLSGVWWPVAKYVEALIKHEQEKVIMKGVSVRLIPENEVAKHQSESYNWIRLDQPGYYEFMVNT